MDVARPDLKKRLRLRRNIIIGGVLTTLAAVLLPAYLIRSAPSSVKQSDILTDTVKRGVFTREVRGPGRLVPSQSRWVIARTEANVERILVRPGAAVESDSVILELSNPEVQDRLQTAKAAFVAAEGDHAALKSKAMSELLSLQSNLAAVEGDFKSAQVEEEASRQAYDKGVMAAVQYKQTKIRAEQLGIRAGIAKNQVSQAAANMRAQLAASETRLEQMVRARELRQLEADALQIRAGLDGVVQQIEVEEGQRVTAGFNLARVARPSTLIAELRIPESQAADLSAGQAATIEIGRARIMGKVRRFNPVVEKGAILVEVDLTQKLPSGVRSEQSVDGTIAIEQIPDALYVGRPVNSSPQTEEGVFRISGGNSARRVVVRFGKESVTDIQVLSGLNEGDKVILSDMSDFIDDEISIE